MLSVKVKNSKVAKTAHLGRELFFYIIMIHLSARNLISPPSKLPYTRHYGVSGELRLLGELFGASWLFFSCSTRIAGCKLLAAACWSMSLCFF